MVWGRMLRIYPRLHNFHPPEIYIDGRVTKMIAYYYPNTEKILIGSRWIEKNYDIIVGEVIPHEIAHHVDSLLFCNCTDADPHGPTWQKIMLKYGLNPSISYEVEF